MRDHNEDAHFIDVDLGVFLVCDGMGGHAAGEVASALAIHAIRDEWTGDGLRDVAEHWLERGTPEAKKQLIDVVRAGVLAAHRAIVAEANRDDTKSGMGTTLVGAMIVGGELVFAHAGDSRAYLVRDGISMQLTEDHTLLARLLAAGIDVDVSGEGARFRSMLTNALGIGEECKVSTFVVPLADGDRFLLCSDGVSEYVAEAEVGEVLSKQSSPARAAQRLIDLALERGGGDNATAVVVRVLEAGETPLPAEQRKKDDAAIGACALWGRRVTPQQRLRALRIAIPRDHGVGDKLPAHALGDRVAWIVVEGELVQDGRQLGPGAFIYPESLVIASEPAPLPDRDALAITRSDVRALAIRADDFRELCDDDGELGEALLESLAAVIARRKPRPAGRESTPPIDPRGATDPNLHAVTGDVAAAHRTTDPNLPVVAADDDGRPRVADDPSIAPLPRAPSPPVLVRPSPLPATLRPSSPGLRAGPTPAHAAATLPHTPNPVHGLPRAPTAGGVSRTTPPGGAMSATPPGGVTSATSVAAPRAEVRPKRPASPPLKLPPSVAGESAAAESDADDAAESVRSPTGPSDAAGGASRPQMAPAYDGTSRGTRPPAVPPSEEIAPPTEGSPPTWPPPRPQPADGSPPTWPPPRPPLHDGAPPRAHKLTAEDAVAATIPPPRPPGALRSEGPAQLWPPPRLNELTVDDDAPSTTHRELTAEDRAAVTMSPDRLTPDERAAVTMAPHRPMPDPRAAVTLAPHRPMPDPRAAVTVAPDRLTPDERAAVTVPPHRPTADARAAVTVSPRGLTAEDRAAVTVSPRGLAAEDRTAVTVSPQRSPRRLTPEDAVAVATTTPRPQKLTPAEAVATTMPLPRQKLAPETAVASPPRPQKLTPQEAVAGTIPPPRPQKLTPQEAVATTMPVPRQDKPTPEATVAATMPRPSTRPPPPPPPRPRPRTDSPVSPPSEPSRLTTPEPSEAEAPASQLAVGADPPHRAPSEPEIETYLEMEADLPPDSGVDPDLESELALSIALSIALKDASDAGDPAERDDDDDVEEIEIESDDDGDDEHASVSITIDDDSQRVIETVTETDSQTLTVTVTEPVAKPMRRRAITAQDAASVSGTISIPEELPPSPRRPKRQSEGRED